MAIPDEFNGYTPGLDSPYSKAVAATPSDSADLPFVTRAVYVGGSGDVAVQLRDGTSVTFTAVPVGLLKIRAHRVLATGTDATNLVVLA